MRKSLLAILSVAFAACPAGVDRARAAQDGGGPPQGRAAQGQPDNSPGAPPEDADAAKARAELEAARQRLAKAVEDARIAEEKAARAERRALEKELAAKEEEVDRFRAAGDDAGAARAEREARDLAVRLAAAAVRAAAGARPAPFPPRDVPALPAPRAPFRADEGLPPLRARRDAKGEAAVVAAALDWLARHQHPGGYWNADGFDAHCRDGKCPGAGSPLHDTGVTGLATLALLGAGETHKTPKQGQVVRNALKYLKAIQDAEGCFGSRTSPHHAYSHAMASLAMGEAYALTQSPLFKASAQEGANYILKCRNPYLAWRYGERPGDNDTAVTGWMVMALRSAKSGGLDVDPEAFLGAVAWLDKVTDPETGRAGYTARGDGPVRPQELIAAFPADRTESLTAEAVFTRLLGGAETDDAAVRRGVDLCLKSLPAWDGNAGGTDFYYWYFGTLAMSRLGGDDQRRWNEAVVDALVPYQRGEGDGCARGSWDPVDPWGQEGGRVYSTAIDALILEVSGGDARVFGGR